MDRRTSEFIRSFLARRTSFWLTAPTTDVAVEALADAEDTLKQNTDGLLVKQKKATHEKNAVPINNIKH